MSLRQIKAGSTDVSVVIRIIDSATGVPETGVVFNTGGIDLWYRRDLAASVDITEATLAALTTAHADGGFLHINDGWYRLDLPDAACASGVAGVQIGGTVTDMVVLAPYIELVVNTPEDVFVRVGLPAGASVSADIAAIEAQTDDIGAAGAGLTAVPWNSAWDAEVESEVDDALGAGTGTALTAIPWNAAWDAEVESEVADALAVYDPPTKAELDTAVANVSVDEIQATALADLFNTDSATVYASAVAGSVVKEIADNAGGSALTAENIADAVLDEALAGHVTAGSLGKAIADTESAAAAVLVDTAEIGAAGAGLTAINLPNQTMDIVGNITGNLSGSVGSVTGAVGSVTGAVGSVTGAVGSVAGNVDGEVGSVGTGGIAAASFAAGAVDAAALAASAGTELAAAVLAAATAAPIDANIQEVNDVTLTGDGNATPWGPV